MLKKHHPLWMSIHFTHPTELTPEVTEAARGSPTPAFRSASQTVLLKDINDDASDEDDSCTGCSRVRVRPYYLYQCDPITGSSHFRTQRRQGPRDHGRPARPHDRLRRADVRRRRAGRRRQDSAPARLCAGRDGDDLLLRNFEGKIYRYPDPDGTVGADRTAIAENL